MTFGSKVCLSRHRVLSFKMANEQKADLTLCSLFFLLFSRAEDVKDQVLCTVTLNSENVQQLHEAIEDLYYFEFIVDDLPVRGFLGQLVEHVLPHSHEVGGWPVWWTSVDRGAAALTCCERYRDLGVSVDPH